MPEESAELLLAGSCPAPRLSPAGCRSPVPPRGTAVPGCVPQDSTSHCSGRIRAVKFLRVHFQVLLKPLCKQRLTCKFAAPHWSPCAAAGGDLQSCEALPLQSQPVSPPHLCGTEPSLPTGFGAASPVPAAWALHSPCTALGSSSPTAQLLWSKDHPGGRMGEPSPSQEHGEVIPGTQSAPGARIPGWRSGPAPAQPEEQSPELLGPNHPQPSSSLKDQRCSQGVWDPG